MSPRCQATECRDGVVAVRAVRRSRAMKTNRVVNIVAWDNGAGLARDIDLLSATLQQLGWTIRYNGRARREAPRGAWQRAYRRVRKDAAITTARVTRRPPFAVNVFLEDISPEFFPLAAKNVLIPNAECFRPASAPFLGQMDAVFAKTQDAVVIFRELGARVEFMGFISADRRLTNLDQPRETEALHVAGRSLLKGTESILDAWQRHPEWPRLTVVRSRTDYEHAPVPWRPRTAGPNVTIIEERLSEQALRTLQNVKRLHIATSESEGFGHSIVEAMSVGAVVVTTDAPPMNELVTPDAGQLVATSARSSVGLGWRYLLDAADLDRQIEAVAHASAETLEAKGAAARRRFEEIVDRFPDALQQCLSAVLDR
jgi:glycosyltransferase involved in cell wall biosynthesis